jgi:hypothetical protein
VVAHEDIFVLNVLQDKKLKEGAKQEGWRERERDAKDKGRKNDEQWRADK